jgi:23S rRNA (adenine2503-C2)-methyltransferase
MGLTHEAFVRAVMDAGLAPRNIALAAYAGFFRRAETGPLTAMGIEAPLPAPARTLTTDSPEGDVVKFLLPVNGRPNEAALETESVVIPMKRKHETTRTLCVSSQVGCAMGCVFCETAQMGLIRSLSAAEIVAQWFAATHALGHPIKNIVFMGMGEPLDNLDSVISAIEILTDHYGPSVPMSGITVSTVGRIDGLMKLREAVQRPGWKQLNLAVSVNAPNDEIRSRIMPINRSMPLGELVPILETWPRRKSGAICAEYVLIPGVNDATHHADELCTLLKGVRCCVNVIPYNPRRGSPWEAPAEETVERFLRDLEDRGQFCKRRRTKGRDTMAACGQLGNEQIRQRKFVAITMPSTVQVPTTCH